MKLEAVGQPRNRIEENRFTIFSNRQLHYSLVVSLLGLTPNYVFNRMDVEQLEKKFAESQMTQASRKFSSTVARPSVQPLNVNAKVLKTVFEIQSKLLF